MLTQHSTALTNMYKHINIRQMTNLFEWQSSEFVVAKVSASM